MKLELKRVDPLRAANIGAVVYGILMSAFAIIVFPFFMLMAVLAPTEDMGPMGPIFPFIMLFVYPVMGVVIGWLSGLLTSAIYNFVIRWTGGLLLEFDGFAQAPTGGASDAAIAG